VCGNGITEPGEVCDGSDCPTTCDDSNACTIDTGTGSAAQCNLACHYALVTACQSGDGCCPQGCTAASDSDCGGSSWQSEVAVDVSQNITTSHPTIACSNALALASSGDAFLTFFADAEPLATRAEPELRIAHRTGGTWSTEVVRSRIKDPIPGKHSLVIDAAGTLHACHFEDVIIVGDHDAFHDVRTPTGWLAEDAGFEALSYGTAFFPAMQACSIAVDPVSSQPRIAYVASVNDTDPFIISANRQASGSWTLDDAIFTNSARQRVPGWPALAIDSTGRSHLAYGVLALRAQPTRGYAFKDAGNPWTLLDVPDGYAPAAMAQTAIALDGNGVPSMVFFTPSDGSITFARRVGGSWQLEMIDPGPADGDVAIAVDGNGRAHVVYRRGANTIVYARQTATSWDLQTVATDATTAPGTGCIGVAVDGSGAPHVSYVVDSRFDRLVKYATRVP
jgi:hypothetical protein